MNHDKQFQSLMWLEADEIDGNIRDRNVCDLTGIEYGRSRRKEMEGDYAV